MRDLFCSDFAVGSIQQLDPHAIGETDATEDTRLRSLVSEKVATVHASSVLSEDGAIAFIGRSGSGKTTLALACAECGYRHIGDEYAYLDLESGQLWHIEYPLGLKPGSPYMPKSGKGVEAISPWGVEYRLFDRHDFLEGLGAMSAPRRAYPLSACVFPEWSPLSSPVLRRASIREWAEPLLSSVDAKCTKNELLQRLFCLIGGNSITMLKLVYPDARKAAMLLTDYFRNELSGGDGVRANGANYLS